MPTNMPTNPSTSSSIHGQTAGAPLPLGTETLPLGRVAEIWAEQLALLGLAPDPERLRGNGAIRIQTARSGARLAELASDAGRLDGRPDGPAAGAAAPLLVLLVTGGRLTLAGSGRSLELADGDLVVLDGATGFSLDAAAPFRVTVLKMPREPLFARLGRARIAFPALLGGTAAGGAARAVLRSLGGEPGDLDPADFSAGEMALTELLASALLGEAQAPDGDMTGVQSDHFRRVAAAIERRLGEADLSPAEIAREVGMSARYLQRLFEKRSESFSDYLRTQRLARCHADLLDPNHARASVAAIGQRWGFRDPAHFSRVFSAAFGMSPTELRRQPAGTGLAYGLRGRPVARIAPPAARGIAPTAATRGGQAPLPRPAPDRLHLPATASTVHWGYMSRSLPPALRVPPGAVVTIETLTQHAGDDWERMVAGDPGAESVFGWTAERKNVDRRGAGPMDASVFGRGAGEGFGVHICTGPIHVEGAEPGDVLEVEMLDIRPRPSSNPRHAGKAFASNASAWWGFQYADLLDAPARHETVTIFEIDLEHPDVARPLYAYRWTPQTDPFGTVHQTMDYPGVPVDHTTVSHDPSVLAGIEIPARLHFGFVAVAPRESEIIDSIPPGYFGGNMDNWRAGIGARIYLPVAVEGALLSIGDGHFALADGEINGTGLECSLTGEVRLTLHKAGKPGPACIAGLTSPLIETPEQWVIQSFSYPNYLRDLGKNAQAEIYQRSSVDLALRSAYRQTRRFLMDVYELAEDEALTLMSLAVDFGVTQVADGNFGVHATIDKRLFAGRSGTAPLPRRHRED